MALAAATDAVDTTKPACLECNQSIKEVLNQCATIALTFGTVVFFDHHQWLRAIRWMGDCSWTFYLGQISILNVVGDSCGMAKGFVVASPYVLFVALTFLLGWGFSRVMCRGKMVGGGGGGGVRDVESAPLLQLSSTAVGSSPA